MEDPCARFRLDGRVAVVTGASSGLGVAFARALAGAGARVVLAARRKAQLEALAGELVAEGASALAVACDVSQEGEVDALVAATLDRFGRADVLINNAGIFPRSPFLELTEAEWDGVHNVNLKGSFLVAQALARRMVSTFALATRKSASSFGSAKKLRNEARSRMAMPSCTSDEANLEYDPLFPSLRRTVVYVLDAVSSHVSATEVRNRLDRNDSIHGLVPPRVEEYITKKAIYR